MNMSVIIPVYNAAPYLEQAVQSALDQPETGEVLLIEDGSTDESPAMCERLAEKNARVRLLHHAGGENRGMGASRNLGLLHAACDYLAFLDSDDYYLPGRFRTATRMFASRPDIDGVCEAVGLQFVSDSARSHFDAAGRSSHTMPHEFNPERLLGLLIDNRGWFHMNGIVVKRSVLERTGPFDEDLVTTLDLAMELKMAAAGRLVAGSLDKPVAMRRIYDRSSTGRVSPAVDREDNKQAFRAVWEWAQNRDMAPGHRSLLFIATCWGDALPYAGLPRPVPQLAKIVSLLANGLRNPSVVISPSLWQELIRRSTKKLSGMFGSEK